MESMIEIGRTYKTNQGFEVVVVKETRPGYYLAEQNDESGSRSLVFDRKGVSAMYVNLFLML